VYPLYEDALFLLFHQKLLETDVEFYLDVIVLVYSDFFDELADYHFLLFHCRGVEFVIPSRELVIVIVEFIEHFAFFCKGLFTLRKELIDGA